MTSNVLSVSQVTDYIKRIISRDVILGNVFIRGEISNFKHHYSGHMYFTLKDDNSRIRCVMFRSACSSLKFLPEDGMNVILSGNVSVYERDGQYQLYVNEMQPDGKGALFIAFEQLKRKLDSEGLFSPENKVQIPKYPTKVGVVTSSTGAAVRDIINVMSRRYPGIEILVVPVMVQGTEAAKDIASAIELLNSKDSVDIIITGRGGGSIEELWAFNEECVARAIYNSRIPVISAVGHETDFTIADYVSDLRAPTPSAAAELCVPDKKQLFYKINASLNSLYSLTASRINAKCSVYRQYRNMLGSLSPMNMVNQKRQYIDSLNLRTISLFKHKLDMEKELLKKYSTNLESLSPLSIISRGYSLAYMSDTGEIIDDIRKTASGDNIDVLVKNGMLKCTVKGVCEEEFVIEKSK